MAEQPAPCTSRTYTLNSAPPPQVQNEYRPGEAITTTLHISDSFGQQVRLFFFFFIALGLELSDTTIYEP